MYRLTVSTGALEIHSNVDTVHVLPASLLNYPDIRIRACHDAGTVINMSKYLDTFDLKSVVWTTADGSVTTDEIGVGQLAAHGTYTYNYTVTNSCVADIKRKVYINMINNGDKFRLPKDTVVVCYEHAEALQINQLFGIEAGGSLKYADNIKSYIKQSATYGGAITMDGTGIYADTSIPFSDYHGVGNVKKIEFTYEDSAGCLQGKTYKIVIVLTPNINP
jgi:hypothetical protein